MNARLDEVGAYYLGVWTQEPDQKGFSVSPLVPLSRAEFAVYEHAVSTYQALTERRTYQILQRNHHRLTSIVATYTNLDRVSGSLRNVDVRAVGTTLMGEMANWLASTRLYLESDRNFLLRTFGADSTQLARHKQVQAQVFDAYPGYRFLYNLRDYTQHCGPPLSGIEVSRAPDGSHVVDLFLSRNELLASRFNWSKHSRAILSSSSAHILVLPLVREAMKGLDLIEDEVLRILLQHCGTQAPLMQEGINKLGQVEGNPAIFSSSAAVDGSVEHTHRSFPSREMLDKVVEAARSSDPLGAVRTPVSFPVVAGDDMPGSGQAAAVLTTWLEHESGVDVADLINRILAQEGGLDSLIGGLVSMSLVQLLMLSSALGTSPEDLLGGFLDSSD